ncbi:DUF6600 domain-containing protein [Massilia sp. GCM10020059]|uniref:FecR domain-containing protein n=1 Tax=Massilia agrisoli TaxID=2892444 RepID=A0ABS8IRB3_9BURK|nr:DUF6600 domain-containing protein [Massilia agrisoli]MCC6070377.1 FecR domain-containing protein [Massilia agrisoli]
MRSPFMRAAAVLALMACSVLAQAQSEAPGRVGRVSLVQGPVTISTEDGDQPDSALVNWPVTSDNRITTQRNGRTEIRIGSTAVRLDGDSSLEVLELDDDRLQLLLHYGSANIRVRNAEVLDGFSIETPQGRVRMREAGRIRVDANPDASLVDVFDGVALVEVDGSTFSLRPGRRVEMRHGDLVTALAVRTSFDDWARLRDQQDDRVVSDRYVTTEMTGYEELDRYGSWSDNSEYGPVWLPRHVSAGWAPYRDGRWTWVSPWGWTWIDNAPWGYAPSHYGRWVMINQRWGWAPGRHIGRPVWAPALVGWVGGSGWSLAFNSGPLHRSAPAQGWYPLGFGEHYAPSYRMRHDHLRHINRHVHPHEGRRRGDDHRRHGLTVVPHDHFKRRAPIVVPATPRAVVTPLALQNAPVLAPQAPAERAGRIRRHRDADVEAGDVSYRVRRPLQAAPAAAVQPQVQAPVTVPVQVQPAPRREHRGGDDRREARVADDQRGDWREERRGQVEEARRQQMEAARREQAEAARRSQLDQLRQAQLEEARRGQADQMRRMQMDEMRRSQMEEMRRARQGQLQAAPAAVQQPAPQQMQQAQPEPRRIAPQPQPQPQVQAPAPHADNPVSRQERRSREESQNRGNSRGFDQH